MDERIRRGAGWAGVAGGLLALLVSVPPGWYGARERDAYLFDPAPFTPLWISRTVVPLLTVVATVGLFVGLLALVRRDWPGYGRLRRWSGVPALVGFALLSLAVIVTVGLGNGQPGTAVLGTVVVLVAGVLGAVLFLPGVLLLGYGYLRAGNRAVGGGLVAVPVVVPFLAYTGVGPDGFLTMVPVGITWVLLGRDLVESGPASAAHPSDR